MKEYVLIFFSCCRLSESYCALYWYLRPYFCLRFGIYGSSIDFRETLRNLFPPRLSNSFADNGTMETPILVYSSGDPFGNHLQHSAYDQLIEGNESGKPYSWKEQTAEFHVLLISFPDGPNQKCPLRKSQPLLARASPISNHWINTLFAFGHSEHKSRQRH